MPRVTFALAEQGDFPKAFAAIHPRFHTPYVSILVFAALVWGFALTGEFKWNVTLSAVARLLYYAVCCTALPVLRRKQPGDVRFRLPAGDLFAGIAVVMCAALITQVDRSQSLIVAATIVLGLVNWLVVRNRKT
jgi:amino acid transporter